MNGNFKIKNNKNGLEMKIRSCSYFSDGQILFQYAKGNEELAKQVLDLESRDRCLKYMFPKRDYTFDLTVSENSKPLIKFCVAWCLDFSERFHSFVLSYDFYKGGNDEPDSKFFKELRFEQKYKDKLESNK